MRPRIPALVLLAVCLASLPWAATPPILRVVPWNGYPAALSLTFDNGDPTQLDQAVPALDQHGWKGTFFLAANRINRREDWRKVFENGHELGNHSLDLFHAARLDPRAEESQVLGARNVLKKSFGVPVFTYAYPYGEISPGLKAQASKTHLAARGGEGPSYVLKPSDNPDWFNLPSRTIRAGGNPKLQQVWLGETRRNGGWTVLTIHAVGGTGEDAIPTDLFGRLLDGAEKSRFWVAPFGAVTSYWRAQKTIENATATAEDGGIHWTWMKQDFLPPETTVLVHLVPPVGSKETWVATQEGTALSGPGGLYRVRVGAQELKFCPSKR